MKYIIVLGDGMADWRKGPLGNATPLEKANKPNIDRLAREGLVGKIANVDAGFAPSSDIANLSIIGYDPKTCYTGRSSLEALSMGVNVLENDACLRTNLVTLGDEDKFEEKTMIDYSAGEISTDIVNAYFLRQLRWKCISNSKILESQISDILEISAVHNGKRVFGRTTGIICARPREICVRILL